MYSNSQLVIHAESTGHVELRNEGRIPDQLLLFGKEAVNRSLLVPKKNLPPDEDGRAIELLGTDYCA
jgi:hypothetical protein